MVINSVCIDEQIILILVLYCSGTYTFIIFIYYKILSLFFFFLTPAVNCEVSKVTINFHFFFLAAAEIECWSLEAYPSGSK